MLVRPPAGSQRAQWTLAALALLAGAALRVAVNDVRDYSRADETHYLLLARALAGHFVERFPAAAQRYLEHTDAWISPALLRWGHYASIAAACAVAPCTHRTLAWLSTLAGIAALLFTWLLARRWLDERAALLALILSVTSPLQLGLGRRALQDEMACATALAALWAVLRAWDAPRDRPARGPYALAVALLTLALSIKETSLLFAPALGALWLLRLRQRGLQARDLSLLFAPLLFALGYCALARTGPEGFFAMVRAGAAGLDQPYAQQYNAGPPHRYLFDLFALAPIVFLLAAAASGAALMRTEPDARPARELSLLLLVTALAFSATAKDVRYLAAADALLRVLAAWLLAQLARDRRAWVWAALGANAAAELWLYQRVFVARAVYDPTTFDLLRALDAIPR